MRAPLGRPLWIRRQSRTDYVKSISEHCVLAAGMWGISPETGDMSVYDLRFLNQDDHKGANDPLVRFPGQQYMQRDACDVLLDRGIVAVYQERRMRLYSLRSGRRISCPEIDQYDAGRDVTGAVWATMPHEQNPSLFVAAHNAIAKFSFGSNFDDHFGPTDWSTVNRSTTSWSTEDWPSTRWSAVGEATANEPTANEPIANEAAASDASTSETSSSEDSSSESSSSEPSSPRED